MLLLHNCLFAFLSGRIDGTSMASLKETFVPEYINPGCMLRFDIFYEKIIMIGLYSGIFKQLSEV